MKRLLMHIFTIFLCIGVTTQSVYATGSDNNDILEQDFVGFDESGNLNTYNTDELEQEVSDAMMSSLAVIDEKAITYGVVNFRVKSSASEITTYTNCENGQQGYVNGYSMSDGAFLGYVNGKVKFKAAGVTGLVESSEVGIVDYDNAKTVSCYKISNGGLYHYVANIITDSESYYSINYVGNTPSYLSNNTTYYSYDGHYFYTSYNKMIDDYKNGVYSNSINSNNPYYNYFQYLPARTKTTLTASQLNQYTTQVVSSGKFLNVGSSLISNQNTYGVNALIMYANAALESGWGQSQIAINKNNLFGHGAVDSNPYYGANGYASVDDCIKYHAKMFISEGYCDPKDYSGRYYGSHLGDKESGINVKYASDPYWGEKIAHICWSVQNGLGVTEVNKYTLGIANGNVAFYTNPGSNLLFNSGNFSSYPVVLLSKSDGYYKVQSDPTLNENRTSITQDKGEYNFDQYYAYINANSVYALNSVQNGNTNGKWIKDGQGYWYWYEGSNYVTGWKEINSVWYYFNTAGVMQTSQWIGNYYVLADGTMAKSQWIGNDYVDASGLWQSNRWMNDGQWWYRYGDGSYPVAKFDTINGKKYYFDNSGYMVTGWKLIDKDWYYFNGSGCMIKDQWIGNYYIGKDGKMAKSQWVGKYYVDASGVWQPDRWINDGQWWYRYGDGSYPKEKFDVIGDNVYYFNKNGYMVTGWNCIDKKWYYFNDLGIMAKDIWIGNYYVDKYGVMTKTK
ncbi:MAG: glucosaminidase domain-containing protein [Holdemanella sp.]|uniref:glucosaminidase domain-containing protein n=1 Tax=Holdemanella sp. TaxID=1971762 RepID=UPI002E792B6E|nr:glucosaminidase domain-containing protein [Holdemanella sp.]MEE0079681.1 glucosaminidase domain-containing protein [Holdemanella sp.]